MLILDEQVSGRSRISFTRNRIVHECILVAEGLEFPRVSFPDGGRLMVLISVLLDVFFFTRPTEKKTDNLLCYWYQL